MCSAPLREKTPTSFASNFGDGRLDPDSETPCSPARQLGAIAVTNASPKLTHGAILPTNHAVIAAEEGRIGFATTHLEG